MRHHGHLLVDPSAGSERFKLVVRDLATGKTLETVTTVGIGNPVWTSDSRGLVFTEVNDQWRSYRARYHVLGRPLTETKTLYEEKDDIAFSVGVDRATDKSLIFISSGNNSTNEVRFVPADKPDAAPVLVSPRKPDRQYEIDAAHGKLWILTNDTHLNFRLASADPKAPSQWAEVIPGSDDTYLRGVTAFRDHLAISARVNGLDQLTLRDYRTGASKRVPFAEASYSASFGARQVLLPLFTSGRMLVGFSTTCVSGEVVLVRNVQVPPRCQISTGRRTVVFLPLLSVISAVTGMAAWLLFSMVMRAPLVGSWFT